MFLGPAFQVTRHRGEGPQRTLARLAIFGVVWINGKNALVRLSSTLADKPYIVRSTWETSMGDGGGHPWARAAIRLRYTNVVSLQRKPAAWGSLPWLLDGGSGVNGVVRLSGPCKRGCRRRHAWKKRGVAGCVAVQVRQRDGLTHRQLTSYTCPHGFSNLGGFQLPVPAPSHRRRCQ